MISFAEEIKQGIPQELPTPKVWDAQVNHAPKRKEILSPAEKKLAIANALRYFPKAQHAILAKEFAQELADYGRIYMYRFMPEHPIFARPIHEYPGKSEQAKAIMLMIQNNLDHRVAIHQIPQVSELSVRQCLRPNVRNHLARVNVLWPSLAIFNLVARTQHSSFNMPGMFRQGSTVLHDLDACLVVLVNLRGCILLKTHLT